MDASGRTPDDGATRELLLRHRSAVRRTAELYGVGDLRLMADGTLVISSGDRPVSYATLGLFEHAVATAVGLPRGGHVRALRAEDLHAQMLDGLELL